LSDTEAIVVLCTVGAADDAERLARELIERRLAACVNLVPNLVSIYRWKGRVERDEERLLVIKTTAARFEALKAAVLALHPNEVPELIALSITAGHEPYLGWLRESVE
jgi:periplasmic divalent cation tolerance protein